MKYSKSITVNMKDFESMKISVEDAPSFETCDEALINELQRLEITASDKIRRSLHWQMVLNSRM